MMQMVTKIQFTVIKALLGFLVLASIGWGIAIILNAVRAELYDGAFPGVLLIAFGLTIGLGIYIGSRDGAPYPAGVNHNFDN